MRLNSFAISWRILTCVCVSILWLAMMPVHAHQQKAGVTTVSHNLRSNHLEVVHRLYMHDAEHAVKTLFNSDADILKQPDTQRQFAQYVTERFGMYTDTKPLPLVLVGYEVDGRFFYVYQEAPKPNDLTELDIRHEVLVDVWPKQSNLVNLEGLETVGKFDQQTKSVRSLQFSDKRTLLNIQLKRP